MLTFSLTVDIRHFGHPQRYAGSSKVELSVNDLACSEKELEQLLSDVAFTRNFGFALQGIADGECSIDVPFQTAFERPGGIVSGQVFMAAADVAM